MINKNENDDSVVLILFSESIFAAKGLKKTSSLGKKGTIGREQ